MSTMMEAELPALRRYGALLLGSKALADDHLERVLAGADFADDCQRRDPYQLFHATPLPEAALQPEDFAEADRRLLATLHKLQVTDRALLLLTTIGALDRERVALVLGSTAADVQTNLSSARSLLQAGRLNRLCMIVEDDLIAMRDLKDELTQGKLGVAGTAKNRNEAFGLAETIRPDIAIIDLALPEGTMAGADVAERLRKRSVTKIIFVTAFAKIANTVAQPGDMIVPKPWSSAALKQAIATATV